MSAAVAVQAVEPRWACVTCGAEAEASCPRPRPGVCLPLDAALITLRLEQAGTTLLAMRARSPYPAGYGANWPAVLHDAIEAYGWTDEPTRPAIPDSAAISRMDLTLGWLALIPQPRHVLRRVVAARCLVSPVTGKHLLGWKRLGMVLRTDYRAVQRWHGQGISAIVTALVGQLNVN